MPWRMGVPAPVPAPTPDPAPVTNTSSPPGVDVANLVQNPVEDNP